VEKPPYEFKIITHFSVGEVERVNNRIDSIASLILEVGSELPKGKYCLKLIKPFPPLQRAGMKLEKLRALRHQDIDHISVFRNPTEERSARVELYLKVPKTSIVVSCKRIQGVPGWNAE